jgi:hypothetical protein
MVEVRIAAARLLKFDSEVHRGILVLRELRERGIPVVGSLFPLGVERGKLEVEYDELVSDEWVWRWVDA